VKGTVHHSWWCECPAPACARIRTTTDGRVVFLAVVYAGLYLAGIYAFVSGLAQWVGKTLSN
jgi:hypothetical protein